MRAVLAACCFLVACGGGVASSSDAAGGASVSGTDSQGAPGETGCSERLPEAVFCRESEPGKRVQTGHLRGDGAAVLAFRDRFDALEASRGALRTITTTNAPRDPIWLLGDRLCYPSGMGAVCAPFAGGASTEWLRSDGDNIPEAIAPVPGGSTYVVAYYTLSRATYLRVVDRAGNAAGGDLTSPSAGAIGWLAVIDDHVVFSRFELGSTSRSLLSVPLAGGEPRTLFTFETGDYASYIAIDRKVTVLRRDGISRVDVVTGAVEELGAPVDPLMRYRQVGRSIVAISGDSVQRLDDHLRPAGSLWERPAGPDRITSGLAAADGALYLSLERSPCTSQGEGKTSTEVCDSTRGRWQILRVEENRKF